MMTVESVAHGIAQIAQQVSGSRAPLPKPSPLRTGHDGFPSSGSSLYRPVPDPHVVSMMAPPVYQLQVVDPVRSAAMARYVVMPVDQGQIFLRIEAHTTHGASAVLAFQQL
jgi:hypothetical protein